MYYEETWIGDSLFWRSSPNGKWNEFTIADYKTKIRELQQQVKSVDLADVVLSEERAELACNHPPSKTYRGTDFILTCTCGKKFKETLAWM